MGSAVSTRRELDDSRTSCLHGQNTAERAQIPGDNGGCPQKVPALESALYPAPQAGQSPLRPSAHGGWIGQVRRVFAVRCRLFGRIPGGDLLTSLLSAVKAVVAGWRQPIGQDREGLPARLTDSAPHPDALVLAVVAPATAPSMANDRFVAADWTTPRQQVQCDHPGSALSSASGSAIKRITAGVKAAADRRCQVSIWGPAFTLPVKSVSNEKRILLSVSRREPLIQNIGRL